MGKMTDRELLELAAKAAGYTLVHEHDGKVAAYKHTPILLRYAANPLISDDPASWEPLQDDSAALRLAVDLGLKVDIDNFDVGITTVGRRFNLSLVEHKDCADKHAATRRAIVLAAAEIGREK